MKITFSRSIEAKKFEDNERCFFWDKSVGFGVRTVRTFGDFKVITGWRYSVIKQKIFKTGFVFNHVEEAKKMEEMYEGMKDNR